MPASLHTSPMEGYGAYNQHARSQAVGAAIAMPLLQQAARSIRFDLDGRPLLIADYGSSQGRNSLIPMTTAITTLRERCSMEQPICISHVDLSSNDFNTLFEMLNADPDSYLNNHPNVFANAIGGSFFQQLLPTAQVVLGWSSFAAQWLSRVPALIPGHFHALRAQGEVRNVFRAQAAADWRAFLTARGKELAPGGRMVIVLPGLDDTGKHGFEPLLEAANESLADLVQAGTIAPAEKARMVVPDCLRSRMDLLAPFADNHAFAGLVVEHCEVTKGPDAAWRAYSGHRDAQMLATARARFIRATFAPTLAASLDPAGSDTRQQTFNDAFEAALIHRLAPMTVEILQSLASMMLAKN